MNTWNQHQQRIAKLRQSGEVCRWLSFRDHASMTWREIKLQLRNLKLSLISDEKHGPKQ